MFWAFSFWFAAIGGQQTLVVISFFNAHVIRVGVVVVRVAVAQRTPPLPRHHYSISMLKKPRMEDGDDK